MQAQTPTSSAAGRERAGQPWWRYGLVWMVIGGPLAVVVASLVTAIIAVVGAEEVLTRPTQGLSAEDAHLAPAMVGRNHAATPRQ